MGLESEMFNILDTFIRPDNKGFKRGDSKFNNYPVNLSHCKGIKTEDDDWPHWTVYMITFHGTEISWYFKHKEERDKLYEVLMYCIKEINGNMEISY